MSRLNELIIDLQNFWQWADTDISNYEINGIPNGIEEIEYPGWENLISTSQKLILDLEKGEYSDQIILLLLEIMALDNENEDILDMCGSILSRNSLELLITKGVSFHLSHARWQIAELIGKKKDKNWQNYLLLLINDSNKYVQRRALLSLSKLNPNRAENVCFQKIKDEDYMLRLVSLRILYELSSNLLPKAMNMLENDSNNFIKKELSYIKKKVREV